MKSRVIASQGLYPWDSPVAFPTGKRKKGKATMQEKACEEVLEKAEEQIKVHSKGALGGPHGGRTGDLPGKPSYEGQRLLHPTPATS